MRSIPTITLGALLALALLTAATPLPADDAGSGGDAGEAPGAALALPHDGTYQGNLTPTQDADWYRIAGVSSTAPTCVEVEVDGSAAAQTHLAARPGPGASLVGVNGTLNPLNRFRAGMIVPADGTAFVGLEPTYLLQGQPLPDAGGGGYQLDLTRWTADEAPTPAQASSVAHQVHATDPVGCFGGDVNATGPDTVPLAVHQGDRIAVALASVEGGDAVGATLQDPDGQVVLEVQDGDVDEARAGSSGTWTLDVTTTDAATSATYLAGLTVHDDDPPPCRPGCFPSIPSP